MHPLEEILKINESWLMHRVRDYAVEQNYTRYTSTLEEAWRISIVGLTDSIAAALTVSEKPWELGPDDNFASDPVSAFGVLEAQKHRSRGVTLEMFMGLMKYYRQSYLDLLSEPATPQRDEVRADSALFARIAERVFDRIEIAFCAEWSRTETVTSAVDELQAANRRMTNEKNMFLTIFESLPTPVFVLDDQMLILQMNQAGALMTNNSATTGGHYYSCPEERIPFPWHSDELSRFRETGNEMEFEQRIVSADSKDCWVLARFRHMKDISFKYSGTLVIFRDITARKIADEMRIKMVKLESIGILTAGIAHDFNNILNIIYGNITFAKMLADGDTPVTELLADAEAACERAKELGVRLQLFSHGNSPHKVQLELPAVIEETADALFKGSNISLCISAADDLLPVKADPGQIRLVFEYLLTNAKEAISANGTVRISIENRELDDNEVLSLASGMYICIAIQDNGKGIPEENLPKIFDPYFSTKDTNSQRGMGLGLSICHAILMRHRGQILVESESGVGTSVTTYLPVALEETRISPEG